LASGPHFYLSNSAPVAIAGTAVISFTIATPPRLSLPLTLGIAAAFATGASAVAGWNHVGDIFNLYYSAMQWITATLIRLMVLRVADSVDAARAERVSAELQQEVTAAALEYDREQMRLLHDTVASTLLMVGDGTTLDPEQIAAYARRDLQVFTDATASPHERADLVAALRRNVEHVATPIAYAGDAALWLASPTVATVAAAAREALTNVDRHAAATAVTITVEHGSVRITDDGRGFDTTVTTSSRHGIARSITGRMQGIGGDAIITSEPGAGTTVELRWPTVQFPAPAA
jgi:signal transduction histidine kinase